MSEDITKSLINKPAKKRTLLIIGSFFAVLLVTVLVLVGMAYALLTSGEKQAYQSPGSASAASDVTVMTPRGASEAIPVIAQDSASAAVATTAAAAATTLTPVIEQLDPTQAIPVAPSQSSDLPGKPLDPTNRSAPQHDLDNLF